MNYNPTITLETFVTIIYCLLTAFILIVAFRQLKFFNRTNNAQFLHNLETKFISAETIKLIAIVHADCLDFDENNNIPIFRVQISRFEEVYPNRKWDLKDYYTTYEIDWLLLNPLDTLGSHVDTGVIDVKSAHQYFGWYINVALSNRAIINYLKWIENYEKTSFVFEKLTQLNLRFQELLK